MNSTLQILNYCPALHVGVLGVFEQTDVVHQQMGLVTLSLFNFRMSVKNTCKMLMALGLSTREVYEDDFEKPLLKESREFYRVSEHGITWLH